VSSRSDFLKQAAGAAAVVAGVGAGAGALAEPASAVLFNPKEYKFLELDGVNVGRLADASGGDAGFAVVIAGFDSNGNPDKQIGRPIFRDFTLEIGSAMSKPMYDWIHASFADPTVRKSGAIIVSDFNYNEVARRTFTNAQITSVATPRLLNRPQSFPAMTVTFAADSVSDDTPSSTPVSGARQKAWLCSNFRFECKNLPANRVASIDSFTWKAARVAGSPPRTDPGDLSCVIAPAGEAAWTQWYDNFALGGDSSDERDALLTVYGQVPQLPLFTWTFRRLGISTLVPSSPLGKMTAEMYCEAAEWDLGKQKGI
jgi:hypothetical protein